MASRDEVQLRPVARHHRAGRNPAGGSSLMRNDRPESEASPARGGFRTSPAALSCTGP
ncbi:hypothetical protein HVPorG_04257 [Roseomonas mucosa]|nr:hypothetical protein HVPorG_04257 [Roseomonas mucosa]